MLESALFFIVEAIISLRSATKAVEMEWKRLEASRADEGSQKNKVFFGREASELRSDETYKRA